MGAKTSSLTWNNQGEKHSTVNVTERSRNRLFPSFVAPRRSCVVRRAMVVNPVADGTHSMMEKLGWASGQDETTLTRQVTIYHGKTHSRQPPLFRPIAMLWVAEMKPTL